MYAIKNRLVIFSGKLWLRKSYIEDIIYFIKVRLDETVMQKVTLEDGNLISKEDFIKVSQDLKLLDFGGPMGEKRKTAPVIPRKDKRSGDTEAVNVSF